MGVGSWGCGGRVVLRQGHISHVACGHPHGGGRRGGWGRAGSWHWGLLGPPTTSLESNHRKEGSFWGRVDLPQLTVPGDGLTLARPLAAGGCPGGRASRWQFPEGKGRESAGGESCPPLLVLLEEAEAFLSLSLSAVLASEHDGALGPGRGHGGHGHGPGHAPVAAGRCRWLFRLPGGRSSDGCVHYPQPRAHLGLRGMRRDHGLSGHAGTTGQL